MENNRKFLKRRKYIINPSFQIKSLIFVIAVVIAIYACIAGLYYFSLRESSKLMGIQKICESGKVDLRKESAEFDRDLQKELLQSDIKPFLYLSILLLFFVAILAGISIIITHRAAGPAYAISYFLKQAAKGNWAVLRPLRKNDEFKFLLEDLQNLKTSLELKDKREREYVQRIISLCDELKNHTERRDIIESILKEIDKILKSKKETNYEG